MKVPLPIRCGLAAAFAAWLVAFGRGSEWGSSWLLALPVFVGAAVAIVVEDRRALRLAAWTAAMLPFIALVVGGDLLGWSGRELDRALWTTGEAVIVVAFLETRLRRWTMLPALVLVLEMALFVMSVGADYAGRKLFWLVFTLVAIAISRARAEWLAEDRALARAKLGRLLQR